MIRYIISFIMLSLCISMNAQNDKMIVTMKNGTTIHVPIDSIDNIEFEKIIEKEEDNKAVDLGLSVSWAAYNLGANAPQEYGHLYSWGEITPKDNYGEDDYLYYKNDAYTSIGNNICGTAYDPVRAEWGEEWRLPSHKEIEELLTLCTWILGEIEGIQGYRVIGPSGKSIFLPAAGYSSGSQRKKDGSEGYYWSGTQSENLVSSAYNLNFKGYNTSWTATRAYGFSIRGVK